MKRSQLLGVLAGLLCLCGENVFAEKDSREKYSWTLGFKPDRSKQFYQPEKGEPLKLDYLASPNTVAEWTAKAIGNQKAK
jgi:hypothetical protein